MLNCWKKDAGDRITFTRALQMLKGQHVNDGNQGMFTCVMDYLFRVCTSINDFLVFHFSQLQIRTDLNYVNLNLS